MKKTKKTTKPKKQAKKKLKAKELTSAEKKSAILDTINEFCDDVCKDIIDVKGVACVIVTDRGATLMASGNRIDLHGALTVAASKCLE